jgi:hypothetical protein
MKLSEKKNIIEDIKLRYSLKNYDLVTDGKVGRYDTIISKVGDTFISYKEGSGMWARGKLISELNSGVYIFRRKKPVPKTKTMPFLKKLTTIADIGLELRAVLALLCPSARDILKGVMNAALNGEYEFSFSSTKPFNKAEAQLKELGLTFNTLIVEQNGKKDYHTTIVIVEDYIV